MYVVVIYSVMYYVCCVDNACATFRRGTVERTPSRVLLGRQDSYATKGGARSESWRRNAAFGGVDS
jgi:hypothetical protein